MGLLKRLRHLHLAAVIAASLPLLATPVFAACTQDRAVYTDKDDDYTLTFKRVPDDAEDASNEFSLQLNETDLRLDGVVAWTEEVARPNGTISYKCPPAKTGEELDACTVWQGVIYALTEGADADLLPKAKEPAAQALLLPDLTSAMTRYNFKLDKPVEAFPWEVFRFKECVPEQ